jgi:hypothetical protein
VGHVLFSDGIHAQSLPTIGKQAIYGMAGALSNPKHYGGARDLPRVAIQLNAMLKQRALIIFISDFVGMEAGWERYIRMMSEKFDLIGIMIRDPRDRALPETGGQILLEDPSSEERIYVDIADYRHLFAEQVKQEEAYVKAVFTAAHAGFLTVTTDDDLLRPILDYFKKRSAAVRS